MEDEEKMTGWLEDGQVELLEKEYHWKQLKKLLSSDPVLKILKARLIGPLRVPSSVHIPHANRLDAIRNLTQLLQDAGITAGSFDAQILLEFDFDHVIDADISLREQLSKLISSENPAGRDIKPAIDGWNDYGASERA